MHTNLSKEFDHIALELIQLLSSFQEEELNSVPFEGSWTAGQVGDHLLKSYQIVRLLARESEASQRQPDQKVELIKKVMLDFETTRQAPEGVAPSFEPVNKESLLNSIQKCREQFKEVIATTDLHQTVSGFVLPQFGEFTKLEWVYFSLYHTQRHIHQLQRIVRLKEQGAWKD
ncbi:MAG TPA: DinB family protein [Sphingobacteriaceae bacterium]